MKKNIRAWTTGVFKAILTTFLSFFDLINNISRCYANEKSVNKDFFWANPWRRGMLWLVRGKVVSCVVKKYSVILAKVWKKTAPLSLGDTKATGRSSVLKVNRLDLVVYFCISGWFKLNCGILIDSRSKISN